MHSIVITGRPNVGKSTLFNRWIGQNRSIVHDEPGVTRDCVFSWVQSGEKEYWLVDTGGYVPGKGADEMQLLVDEQVVKALDASSLVVIVFDGKEGLTALDEEFVGMVRRMNKPILGVVNKADPGTKKMKTSEFYALGIQDVVEVSAEHGLGVQGLKEDIETKLPVYDPVVQPKQTTDRLSIAFVGRPNVGKSSMINRILDEPRLIVSEKAGTTRDVIDVAVDKEDRKFLLLDTAGLRRRHKVTGDVEHFSAVRSMRAIERADVVVLVIDATQDLTSQDERIGAAVVQKGAGLLIAANKWDLVKENKSSRSEFRDESFHRAPFLKFASLKFVSAKSGMGMNQLLTEAWRIEKRKHREFPQEELDRAFDRISSHYTASGRHGGNLKLYGLTQAKNESMATLFVWCNDPRKVTVDYDRFFRNAVSDALQMEGVPIKLAFRRRSSKAWADASAPPKAKQKTKLRFGR